MKTSNLRKFTVLAGAVLVAVSLDIMPVSALDNPVNPNAPSPNSGVTPGHRAAGSFASKRPGNLPVYGPKPHSFTGVTSTTPGAGAGQ